MKISLIVCSRNRASKLPAFFSHVEKILYPERLWELIFVDNGSTDETARVAQAAASQIPGRLLYVREPRKGLANARNAGVAAATGDILVFTDDDCFVYPSLLSDYAALYADEGVAFAGGRVLPLNDTTPNLSMQQRAEPLYFAPHSYLETGIVHGANMSMRREVPRTIGPFDPLLGAGAPLLSGEDAEYLARASFSGFAGLYSPLPTVVHAHDRTTEEDIASVLRGYAIGRGAYYIKMIVRPTSRGVYSRKWYWSLRADLRSIYWRQGTLELRGALQYLIYRAIARPRRKSA